MLYSRNLITKPTVSSYNNAVRQINIDNKQDLEELKAEYEKEEALYEEYQSKRATITKNIETLNSKIAYLHRLTEALR